MLAGANGGKTVECWKTYDEYLIASVTPLYAALPTPPVLLGAEAEGVPVCAATEGMCLDVSRVDAIGVDRSQVGRRWHRMQERYSSL